MKDVNEEYKYIHSNCIICVITDNITFPCKRNPKGLTTQMKALDEYILMVLFVLLLKRVHFLVNQT